MQIRCKAMHLRLIRNATLRLELDGRRILVDPMLDPAGARPPVEDTENDRRNPLVELPEPAEVVIGGIEAVLLTHLHRDHFDDTAAALLPRDLPVLCQPEDAERLRGHGFADVRPVAGALTWEGIEILRTPARHGSGATAEAMAPVSGFVLRDTAGRTLYVAGDTVLYEDVEAVLDEHRPDVVVVNAGAARFTGRRPDRDGRRRRRRRRAPGARSARRRGPPRRDQPLRRDARRPAPAAPRRGPHRPRHRPGGRRRRAGGVTMAGRDSRVVWSSDDGDVRKARGREDSRPAGGGRVKVRRETGGRRGKTVTTVTGVPLGDAELRALAGRLKKRCGVGGSAKDGTIELQGDQRDAVMEVLRAEGYDAVLAGGEPELSGWRRSRPRRTRGSR